ncbi:MAG: LacI family DNA-binding transcriptional regulator [Stomatobaculum sp.]|nr:LacI family DNA-binding transcriptional regulator [Stomatobaculum sp.]
MPKITIKDVALKAGVSLATVSRVMNGNQSVDPELKARVLEAARELNYGSGSRFRAPSAAPRRIAMIVPMIENTYYSSIVAGVIDVAQQNGMEIAVMHTKADPGLEDSCFRQVLDSGVDGIIFSGTNERNPLDAFPELSSIPMVVAARRLVIPGIPHIYHDNVNAGYIATKYLLRLHRKNIALLVNFWEDNIHDYETFLSAYHSSAQGTCTAFDRYTGYARALEEDGLTVDPSLIIFSGFSHESGYASAQTLLTNPREFDGVLVSNDRCATGVLRLFREQGLDVPGQVSLICFNGGLIANVVTPSLTMIEQDNYGLGVQAAAQLIELLNGRPAHDVKLDVSLSIKGSTALAV